MSIPPAHSTFTTLRPDPNNLPLGEIMPPPDRPLHVATYPGGFDGEDWLRYESMSIEARAAIEASVPAQREVRDAPMLYSHKVWHGRHVPVLDLAPGHRAPLDGLFRTGVGHLDTGWEAHPAFWDGLRDHWNVLVIARPGQFLGGLQQAFGLHLQGAGRVLLVADSEKPDLWAKWARRNGVMAREWRE